MSTTASAAPQARLSATVLLLRDGPQGLEVFMVVRHQQIDFASGALVFPGGKLAPGDFAPALRQRCSGAEQLSDEQLALHVGAIRETFEECGVLLAREPGAARLLAPERLDQLGRRYRAALDRGETGMLELLQGEDLQLACEELAPFAHWITPSFMPKRFDTYFYLAAAPLQQIALHDGREMVDSVWLRPAQALEEAAAGRRTLVPVTQLNVAKLGRSASVAAALAAARAGRIVTVQPQGTAQAGGMLLRIPVEADYGVAEFFFPTPAAAP
jgi:8-oxo-dGTP pyrophosphatase MutT (NUDIX family)